jgi:hypothetical protein
MRVKLRLVTEVEWYSTGLSPQTATANAMGDLRNLELTAQHGSVVVKQIDQRDLEVLDVQETHHTPQWLIDQRRARQAFNHRTR